MSFDAVVDVDVLFEASSLIWTLEGVTVAREFVDDVCTGCEISVLDVLASLESWAAFPDCVEDSSVCC